MIVQILLGEGRPADIQEPKVTKLPLITTHPMCVTNTPVEDHLDTLGLLVKREDLCCPPGPHFSKTRGVWAHLQKRPEALFGVLDTSHSQGGWAVAQASRLLGKKCQLFYPERKAERGKPLKPQQLEAQGLGADVVPLQAGRSAVLYHQAKRAVTAAGGYMVPNALKLPETVEETEAELLRTLGNWGARDTPDVLLISASSATIAAGLARVWQGPLVVHMGYSRSLPAVQKYLSEKAGIVRSQLNFVDEEYAYADAARAGGTPPWPCNAFYDLKAFRWWVREGRATWGRALMWNVG
jgi:hypothetical protein